MPVCPKAINISSKNFDEFDFYARLIRQESIYSTEREPHAKCSVVYTLTLIGLGGISAYLSRSRPVLLHLRSGT